MKLDTSSAILTCATLLLLHGISRSTVLASPYVDDDSGRRIMNGDPSNPADFPFYVRLFVNGMTCGGSVVANFWIITAGHCLLRARCEEIQVYPFDWQGDGPSPIHVAECVTHPQYDPTRYAFDVALLRTVEDLVGGGLRAVPLAPPGTHYPPGTLAITAGWGKIGDNLYPRTLLRGESAVMSWDVCNSMYSGGGRAPIPNRILCTQGQGPRPQTMCGGDSGGPVIINGELAAINTASIYSGQPTMTAGCIPGSPTLHTSIVDYLPWIFSIADPSVNTAGFPVAPESTDTLQF